nr:PilW family protein [uncultured Ralstonia sp.]
MPRPLARPARGASLVELLVGMVIALMVLGIALQLTLIARARYQRLADEALIEDRGMRALELIGNAVRQAGWITDIPGVSSVRRWPSAEAPLSLFGVDDCDSPKGVPDLECGTRHAEQRSDALMARFSGRNKLPPNSTTADGAMHNCIGFEIPERTGSDEDPRLGSMLLFISISEDGELAPRLMCRSFAPGNTPAEGRAREIVRGVEILQLLYTLAPTPTSPEKIVSARAMSAKDWYRVQLVHVAIVVRGDRYSMRQPALDSIALFREITPAPDAQSEDLSFRPKDPRRNRARFTATFAVRNPLRCEADAC